MGTFLKKHTTAESYTNLPSLQEIFQNETADVNFRVVAYTSISNRAYVRCTTSFGEKPGVLS